MSTIVTRLLLSTLCLCFIITDGPAQSFNLNYSFAFCVSGEMLIAPGGADSFIFPEDHLIDVYVYDDFYNPVEVIATDIWLEHPNVVWCNSGVFADSSTYAPDPGHTTFSSTPCGGVTGDCDTIHLGVVVLGYLISELDLQMVSPDLDGSGSVDIVDFSLFGAAYNQVSGLHCADLDRSYGQNSVSIADFAVFIGYYLQSECIPD